jgi:DNA-binding NarL/FixJ family response regulator
MPMNVHKVELLWTRLEDAKLQLDLVHSHIQGVNQDQVSGAVPSADSRYAYERGLKAEEAATKNHLVVLQEFKAALDLEQAPQEESAVKTPTQHADTAISPREREVLALIALGKSSREIAMELGIAFRTVVCHRYRLYQKLKVHTSVELIRAAMRKGLIQL